MFDKHKLSRNGVQAQALVLEQKVYAIDRNTGGASACRYTLRVKFEDGTTSEISYRVFSTKLAAADVGDLIPVRYDPADRSKIELDRQEISAQKKARARDLNAEAIARGEKALEGSSTAAETTSWNVGEEESRDHHAEKPPAGKKGDEHSGVSVVDGDPVLQAVGHSRQLDRPSEAGDRA